MKTFLETCERSFGCSGPASEHVSRIFKQEMRGTCLQRLRRRARASRQLAGGALIVEVLSSPSPPSRRPSLPKRIKSRTRLGQFDAADVVFSSSESNLNSLELLQTETPKTNLPHLKMAHVHPRLVPLRMGAARLLEILQKRCRVQRLTIFCGRARRSQMDGNRCCASG